MSQRMRDLIPFRHIILEVSCVFGMKYDSCNSYTTTFENNKVAIELENIQNTDLEQKSFHKMA